MDSLLNNDYLDDENPKTHRIYCNKNKNLAPLTPPMARALRSLKHFVGVAQIVCIRAATMNFRQERPPWHRQIVPAGTTFFFVKSR